MNRIGDYAVIGDCHSLGLVGRDGSIDWLCFPRFDSPSVFARTLDASRGGHFSIAPAGQSQVHRTYLPSTNVLATTFETDAGTLEVVDCMPVLPYDESRPAWVGARHSVLRRVRCTSGRAVARVDLAPRFEYAAVVPRFRQSTPTTAEVVGGTTALWVRSTHPLRCDDDALVATWELTAGDEAWIEAAWSSAHDPLPEPTGEPVEEVLASRLRETIGFWERWLEGCRYEGEHDRKVHRSALVLKALTYAPTGAVVAAGTTGLPEWLGGSRNWDYRFTWIRDATLTLTSLLVLGYRAEADAFKLWLERTGAGRPDDLQIMYGIGGERMLPEIELDHLDGHRGSRPVRIGNAAVNQIQLDSYGQILDAAYLYAKAGGDLDASNWQYLQGLADAVVVAWQQPDSGIWEMRDRPRHFVHSKLNCWLALDRAVRIAEAAGLPADLDTWRRERDLIADYLLTDASPHGWFRQASDVDVADASTLLVPALGFLPTTDDRVLRTIEVVERDLAHDGLVHRYRSPDGLEGDEGAFLLCSFWLLDCLIHAGRLDDADTLLGRLLELSNDVGVYAEMVHPSTGEQLGNTPQAFTHMALITSCAHLSAARQGLLDQPPAAKAYAEMAIDRLAAVRR